MVSYERTIAWLYALEARAGMDFRLERLHAVLRLLGHPQRAFPSIHVVGTNGKGSTAAMLHSVYHAARYRVGLYTSPHLVSFRERIVVGDRRIERDAVVRHVERVRRAAERARVSLTFFEITTLAALLEFEEAEVDLAVVEAGLGGRLDATNVVRSAAVVFTSLGRDHEAYLGERLEGIAAEKVAVLGRGGTLVTGPLPEAALDVVAARVRETCSTWLHYGRDFGPSEAIRPGGLGPGLRGAHQRRNAGVAAALVGALADRFPVADDVRDRALANTRWPGRLEVFDGRPRIIVDAAHNPQAAVCLREALPSLITSGKVVLLFGVMADKDWREMLCTLLPICDHVVLTPVSVPRSLDPRWAFDVAAGLRTTTLVPSAREGLEAAAAAAGDDGTVVVTGSIFLVGEVYPHLRAVGGRGADPL